MDYNYNISENIIYKMYTNINLRKNVCLHSFILDFIHDYFQTEIFDHLIFPGEQFDI